MRKRIPLGINPVLALGAMLVGWQPVTPSPGVGQEVDRDEEAVAEIEYGCVHLESRLAARDHLAANHKAAAQAVDHKLSAEGPWVPGERRPEGRAGLLRRPIASPPDHHQ